MLFCCTSFHLWVWKTKESPLDTQDELCWHCYLKIYTPRKCSATVMLDIFLFTFSLFFQTGFPFKYNVSFSLANVNKLKSKYISVLGRKTIPLSCKDLHWFPPVEELYSSLLGCNLLSYLTGSGPGVWLDRGRRMQNWGRRLKRVLRNRCKQLLSKESSEILLEKCKCHEMTCYDAIHIHVVSYLDSASPFPGLPLSFSLCSHLQYFNTDKVPMQLLSFTCFSLFVSDWNVARHVNQQSLIL